MIPGPQGNAGALKQTCLLCKHSRCLFGTLSRGEQARWVARVLTLRRRASGGRGDKQFHQSQVSLSGREGGEDQGAEQGTEPASPHYVDTPPRSGAGAGCLACRRVHCSESGSPHAWRGPPEEPAARMGPAAAKSCPRPSGHCRQP